MKKLITLVSFILFPLLSCEDTTEDILPIEDPVIRSEIAPGLLKVNFNAVFYSEQTDPGDLDAGCLPPLVIPVYQTGFGSTPVLGKFRFEGLFCINPLTGEYGGGESSFGQMIFEGGDKLYIIAKPGGQVLPSDHPKYDIEFHDEWIVLGGTGKFENASGEGTIDSFGTNAPPRTQHHWKGTVYLMNEKI